MEWPHAPVHRLNKAGAYILTAATYLKRPIYTAESDLQWFQNQCFEVFIQNRWELQAWSFFPNHYHLVFLSEKECRDLSEVMRRFHGRTSHYINSKQKKIGRKVWYNFWDSHISYHRSYLARLNYVHQNPVHHGLVQVAEDYPWCSAAWFRNHAPLPFQRTVNEFDEKRLNIRDDF